ncbi:uncharacterized protein LOC112346919 isoform X2 [Selaginella moellendorffii]|uniref:uncharacterized protein LOC112346919 isoform X2 n=1 Tax=Selaginella moellendorffii TaxID=88036 RepID=UPI000D1CEF19|nr:uncharacterized protein LOC112346919 isoform X2 [Selaginella moellendorffii]|eukprot:XP_024532589.1 uncharacterized protein LOC112346919 isoform X2 [Selaginella moellendorffii]
MRLARYRLWQCRLLLAMSLWRFLAAAASAQHLRRSARSSSSHRALDRSRRGACMVVARVYRGMGEILRCGFRMPVKDLPVAHCEGQRDFKNASAVFHKKMEVAGVSCRDRVAIAVSGGADSMALCLLALEWTESKSLVFGLTVDHGFRRESAEEVVQVREWLRTIGMECEILKCSWQGGFPSPGHLQESARKARYELLQEACQRNGAGVLLTAHHADDQAELFALRLSRCSGDNGLACMALASELFPIVPSIIEASRLLLVRPLLDLQKKDLYNVCHVAGQSWIEDPTNCKTIYARNKIRKELVSLSDSMRSEVQDLIATYRKKRSEIQVQTKMLMTTFVHIDLGYGYAVVDVEGLLAETNDTTVLETLLASVLRFVSQRPKPAKGTAVRRARAWITKRGTEGRLTVAGCSLCLQPGTQASKVLVTYSPDSPRPGSIGSRQQNEPASSTKKETIACRKYANVIHDARQAKIISDATASFLCLLAEEMAADMLPKAREEVQEDPEVASQEPDESLLFPNENTYYMKRYLISWWQRSDDRSCKGCFNGTCSLRTAKFAKIRDFKRNDLHAIRQRALNDGTLRTDIHGAWRKLKSLPEYVRRGLPVLITKDNELFAVPICPDTRMFIKFCPMVPLDGGHALCLVDVVRKCLHSNTSRAWHWFSFEAEPSCKIHHPQL